MIYPPYAGAITTAMLPRLQVLPPSDMVVNRDRGALAAWAAVLLVGMMMALATASELAPVCHIA